jgi:integrase
MFNRLPAAISGADAATINPLAFRAAVESVWPENAVTADRMIKRLATLLEFQRSGYVKGKATKVKHHPAMGYAEIPAYFAKLADPAAIFGRQASPIGYGSTGRALRWTILTAARTDETVGATWGEIGEVDGSPVWSLTAERMKAEEPHIVPLCPETLALIGERGSDDELLFKSVNGNAIDKGAMLRLLKGTQPDPALTVHGFRTSLRSWAADCTDFPREICEKALAHTVPGVEGAYNRGDLLAKRRKLMEAWCAFALHPEENGIVLRD